MASNVINQVAYLPTTRIFPEDLNQLSIESNRSYIDTANAVNNRIIGLYSVNRPAITGESWYFNNLRRQSQRQIYIVTAPIITGSTIKIGFKLNTIFQISPRTYGSFTDALGNWYGLIYASSLPIAGQISFFIQVDVTPNSKSDQIVFEVGAGAPVLTNGTIDLEWIVNI
jgi:hypothetical protein